MDINNFKKISIRARQALAIKFLIKVLQKNNLSKNRLKALSIIIESLKKFTYSKHLDDWHDTIEKLLPEYILQADYEKKLSNYISVGEYSLLSSTYDKLSEDLKELITTTAWVGISNIYGSTGEYSSTSLEYLNDVIDFSSNFSVEINDINYAPLMDLSFEKERGWGETFFLEERCSTSEVKGF